MPLNVSGLKNYTGNITKNRNSNGSLTENSDPLEAAAHVLIAAIETKDAKHVANALREAFKTLEMRPHQEISHTQE